jgi:hypothetical protein
LPSSLPHNTAPAPPGTECSIAPPSRSHSERPPRLPTCTHGDHEHHQHQDAFSLRSDALHPCHAGDSDGRIRNVQACGGAFVRYPLTASRGPASPWKGHRWSASPGRSVRHPIMQHQFTSCHHRCMQHQVTLCHHNRCRSPRAVAPRARERGTGGQRPPACPSAARSARACPRTTRRRAPADEAPISAYKCRQASFSPKADT